MNQPHLEGQAPLDLKHLLLVILVIVAGNAWLTKKRTQAWEIPLEVVIYPINGDGSRVSDKYIAGLEKDVFKPS